MAASPIMTTLTSALIGSGLRRAFENRYIWR